MPQTDPDSANFKPKTFVESSSAQEERCMHCSVLLLAISGGERSASQMQCDECVQKEMVWWLNEMEAMNSGQMTQEEHAAHIAGKVMQCPKIYKESVVEWAKKMTE